ncbi:hypothetical protein HYV74_01665 [Candidatus Uhrbacteria bacterium]|nr:hypothetical protein [Candidatus Uhrbacteria bacterium]
MTSLASEVSITQSAEFFGRFGRFGGTVEQLALLLGDDNLMDQWVQSIPGLIDAHGRGSYEMTIDAQLAALRRANNEEQWGLTEEDFTRLTSSAPAWPKGRSAYRSFRIRFGEGDEGVARTFEAHYARIQHVFGEGRFWPWERLRSGAVEYKGEPVECLRLLNGNHTHHAVVEWIVADCNTNRDRESITAVRDTHSLADELLVIAWMFPDMIRAIDYDKLPGLFAAGYEVNVPESGGKAWQDVVVVHFRCGSRQVSVRASGRSNDDSGLSVPRLRE